MTKRKVRLRRAVLEEEELVSNFIKNQFGLLALSALENLQLWIREGKVKEVYAVSLEMSDILGSIELDIYSAGIPLGIFSDSTFHLEIEGAALILPFTKKILYVKTKQFLYGKPIFVANVEKIKSGFKKDDFLIIIGEKNLHYGIGRAKIDSSELELVEPNSVLITGYKRKPMDRGWYLREEN